MSQGSKGGIDGTLEWRLITGLRDNSHLLSRPKDVLSRASTQQYRDRKTTQLLNDMRMLDMQIRKTLTILRLDLLLFLESEIDDDTSGTSSRTGSDQEPDPAGYSSDDDDLSSQSSGGVRLTPQQGGLSRPPDRITSSSQAFSYLQELCSLLEARVNPLLIPVEPVDSGQSQNYPRLTHLVQHLGSSPFMFDLECIPTDRSISTKFLFNIAKDTTAATAFITFCGPEQKPLWQQHEGVPEKMFDETEDLKDRFEAFNNLVDKLQTSPPSLEYLATWPSESLASSQPCASFTLLRKFCLQTAVAHRAVTSHFRSCDHQKFVDHDILLQLPAWKDVSDWDSSDVPEDLAIQLFFTTCSQRKWQAGKMYLLLPEQIQLCKQQELCTALCDSDALGRDLEFYVLDNYQYACDEKIPIHVPENPKTTTQKFGKSYPNKEQSLWTMIKEGYFAKEPSIDLLLRDIHCTEKILAIDQRKALATRLILGLMVYLDVNSVFESWDPDRIHFLEPVDTERTPFVSITQRKDSTDNEGQSLLASYSFNGVEDSPRPLPQFLLLAKALLQIASGERLEGIHITQSLSRPALLHMWKAFQEVLHLYTLVVTCGAEVDREKLPFLMAAKGCLDFHIEYQACLSKTQSSQKIDLARKVVFDTILVKIDDSLALRGVIGSGSATHTEQDLSMATRHPVLQETPVLAVNASIHQMPSDRHLDEPKVTLFDTKQGSEHSTADEFLALLDEFHISCSNYITNRVEDSKGGSLRRIRIAVLDTGVDFAHPGLRNAISMGRIKKEWCHNWVGTDPNAFSDNNELHGSNCAYLLHKAAPEADIYVGKIFAENVVKDSEAENIASAIKHAVNNWDVDIISMSFGLRRPSARKDRDKFKQRLASEQYEKVVGNIEEEIWEANFKSPRLLFAAASNNGKNERRAFPASCSGVFCVHASEGNGKDGGINPEMEMGFNFMTLGMGLELKEKEKLTIDRTEFPKYNKVVKSGTSFATPIAAGIAATVLNLAQHAERAGQLSTRARNNIRRHYGMEKMLRIMSSPNHDVRDRMCYMAPWHHWRRDQETKDDEMQWIWSTIDKELS